MLIPRSPFNLKSLKQNQIKTKAKFKHQDYRGSAVSRAEFNLHAFCEVITPVH